MLSIEFKEKKSKEIIKEAFERFDNLGLFWSGGKDSTVMLYLVLDVIEENNFEEPYVVILDPIPFEENVKFQTELVRKLGLKKVVDFRELIKEEYKEKAKPFGLDKKKCCYWLKVKPLNDFIEKYKIDGLFVAIRWDEHPERGKEKYFSERENPKHVRIHPMLHWSWLDVWLYIKKRNLPVNPLYFKGYTSLGCKICTSIVKKDGFKNIDEIIEFIKEKKVSERAGRDIDKERIMENLRKLGYF